MNATKLMNRHTAINWFLSIMFKSFLFMVTVSCELKEANYSTAGVN